MTNLLSHASGILEDKAATTVVWTAAGVAIPKAISCSEIIKRQFNIEHQITKLTYKKLIQFSNKFISHMKVYKIVTLLKMHEASLI